MKNYFLKVKIDENDMAYDIDYEDLNKKIEKNSYSLIFLTSPSYEGFMIDLKKVKEIIKDKNILLLVDMAHGSHTILSDYENNFSYDLAITSFHKNLSALTPASGIIIKNKNIDIKNLRRNMAIFQTSSPSYLVSGSIDDMISNFSNFYGLWDNLLENLTYLYKTELKNLKYKKSNFSFEFIECEKKLSIKESFCKNISLVDLDKSQGKISASYIYAYPPGIPLLIPGEIINKKIIDHIKYLQTMGIDLSLENSHIPIINWQKLSILLLWIYRKKEIHIWKELLL